ncbi:GTPase family protein [Synechococcus elongatus]|uniref:GTPase family protein n=1 Tax=Synechococcus elongatus TaxID=32046 RepID=UPI000584DA90|nr:GTPase [Synechococcus elongatus]MBD2587588.1 50S ribosome-binding GTPase [Synechococcus elongatus FACHB-242]UOW70965.1 DUF697 family protein [Synechococcus elongatus PCC 7943]UOW73686.1 DUF697 family protein [Synechococcus elongatus PCC 6311]MBD2688633.1 50S ribosome-binding GTPase [Synechococcus elongatus FACHB-1061]MBD2707704.1 50S ribosome-binding GTPase [Synechococcus elongatus PCC 7942 = FACHB-805]
MAGRVHHSSQYSSQARSRLDPSQQGRRSLFRSGLSLPGAIASVKALAFPLAIAVLNHPLKPRTDSAASEPIWQKALETWQQWFGLDRARATQLLESVQQQLAPTEIILIGKTQSGKSSIIRGLTGASADIVGQGFRPHTQHTQRYDYPSELLPLLTFIDTVGLGEAGSEPEAVLAELSHQLETESDRPRLLVWTVKVSDFAVDEVLQLAKSLRQRFPAVPALLVLTCRHELYPPEQVDHPDPEEFEQLQDLQRAIAAQRQTFAGCSDRQVDIDFTRPEDPFRCQFEGRDRLIEALSDLLPQAEAQALLQLVSGEVAQALERLYRSVSQRYQLAFSLVASGAAAIPLPFAAMPLLTALQTLMVVAIGRVYGQTLNWAQASALIASIGGGFLAQLAGRELLKFIPGWGSAVAAAWAGAYTWALGEAATFYFAEVWQGKIPDRDRIRQLLQHTFERYRAHWPPPEHEEEQR